MDIDRIGAQHADLIVRAPIVATLLAGLTCLPVAYRVLSAFPVLMFGWWLHYAASAAAVQFATAKAEADAREA